MIWGGTLRGVYGSQVSGGCDPALRLQILIYCSLLPFIHSPKKPLTPVSRAATSNVPTQLLVPQILACHPVKSPSSFSSHGEASLFNT